MRKNNFTIIIAIIWTILAIVSLIVVIFAYPGDGYVLVLSIVMSIFSWELYAFERKK